MARIAELQASLSQASEASAAHEAAALERADGAATSSAPASGADKLPPPPPEPPEGPARRGEVAELRRQLQLLEDARKHSARMLLAAEERAQALASAAAAHERVSKELRELEAQHATCLELLGERNDRVDELELVRRAACPFCVRALL